MTGAQFLDVEGHKIAYHRAGRGEAVFLVHGITTYSFVWEYVFDQLSAHFDVVALDLLGCGESDKPLTVSYSINHHAEIIKAAADTLGILKFHFVGHDIGGGIAQVFAVRYPGYLFDATIINGVAYDFWPVQPIIAMRTPIIRQMALATLDFGTFKLIVKRGVVNKENVTDKVMEQFWMPMRTKEGRKAFLHFAESLDNSHLTGISDQLRTLQLPVHIIRGDGDVYLSAAIAERLHHEIPGSTLTRFPRSGHFIFYDEVGPMTEAIRTFFTH